MSFSLNTTKQAFARDMSSYFLDWVDYERRELIKIFRLSLDCELALARERRKQVLGNDAPDGATLRAFCQFSLIRLSVEPELNILDFGSQYGRADYASKPYKQRFMKWLRNRNTRPGK